MEKVKQFLLDDINELKSIVSQLNSWDGSLEHLSVYENDEEFFNTYFEGNPMEAVRASHYGDYNFTDEYVRFDGYSNLESLSEYAYERELKDEIDEIVDLLIENQSHLYLDAGLEELLEEEDEEEDEEEIS